MVLEALKRIEVGQVSSHLLRRFVPAAALSALVVTLTMGVSAAQAAVVIRGRGMPRGALAVGHGGSNIGVVIIGIAVLALVVGGAIYAIVTDRRLVTATPAVAAAEPAPLLSVTTEAEKKRRAA
jgi:hypothetical protein